MAKTTQLPPPVKTLAASSQDVAKLTAKYPQFADRIAKGGVTIHGAPVVSKEPVQVPGGWSSKTLSVHQKFRLADGTVVSLDVD